jgi:predicted dehydrogenase
MLLGNRICENISAMAYKPESYPLNIRTTCSSAMFFQDDIMVYYFGSMGTKSNPIGWTGKIGIYGEKGAMIRDEKSEPYIELHEGKEKYGIEDEFGDNADDFIPLIEYTGIAFLMEDLFHAIRENRQSVADLRDNIYSHKILLGTKKSADTKTQIQLEEEYKL